jgi:hypothetical protein
LTTRRRAIRILRWTLKRRKPHPRTSSLHQALKGLDRLQPGKLRSKIPSQHKKESNPLRWGWDPSVSQDVLGYKVYLADVSSSAQEIIDVGPKTELAISLRMGGSYGFTVTAYNSSFESQALPYLLFQVF